MFFQVGWNVRGSVPCTSAGREDLFPLGRPQKVFFFAGGFFAGVFLEGFAIESFEEMEEELEELADLAGLAGKAGLTERELRGSKEEEEEDEDELLDNLYVLRVRKFEVGGFVADRVIRPVGAEVAGLGEPCFFVADRVIRPVGVEGEPCLDP